MQRKHNINEILEKGSELIREKGYTNTGIDDILRVSNIPKGSFYNFFRNKEEFGVRILQVYTERQLKRIKSILGDENMKTAVRAAWSETWLRKWLEWAIP